MTLYLPDFVSTIPTSCEDLIIANEEYKSHDWLTPGLHDELQVCFPSSEDVHRNSSNARSMEAFQSKFGTFFLPGRILQVSSKYPKPLCPLVQMGRQVCSWWETDHMFLLMPHQTKKTVFIMI